MTKGYKVCGVCHKKKPLSKFHIDRRNKKDNRKKSCAKCKSERDKRVRSKSLRVPVKKVVPIESLFVLKRLQEEEARINKSTERAQKNGDVARVVELKARYREVNSEIADILA